MFQSPCGDYVSGKLKLAEIRKSPEVFQSPCGDYVSGKPQLPYPHHSILDGFSPLAGIMLAESTSGSG